MPPRRTSEELLCLFQENWPEGYSPSEEVMLRLYHSALRHTEAMQRFLTQFDLSFAEFVLLRVLRRESPPHVMTPTALYETLVMSPGGITKVLKQLEANAAVTTWLSANAYSPVELFQFTTTDGQVLDGSMIKPPDFDPARKYPVILAIYGGPGSQQVYDRFGSSGIDQWRAQQGYIIVGLNNRGSNNYGSAFMKQVYRHLGKYEAMDFAEAARWLAKQPYVDGTRIGDGRPGPVTRRIMAEFHARACAAG